MKALKNIEYIYTMQEITDIVDELFPIDDSCNIDKNGWFIGWKNREERAKKEYITGLFIKHNNINRWLKGDLEPYKYPTYEEVKEKKEERKKIYDELCKELYITQAKIKKSSYPHYSKDNEVNATRQFERLVKDGYFSQEASLDDWLYIYGVKGKAPNKKPLEWQKTQKELAYMVRRIWQNTDTKMWAICEAVFTIKGKKPNTDVMKSDLSSIDNGYKNRPETFDRLDEVLKG